MDFLKQYIETALWSSTDESTPQGGEPLDKNYGPEDLVPETLERMTKDCEAFQKLAGPLLSERDESHGGHDFWLTRNGHGAGFWDGDWPKYGDHLTELSKTFGEQDLYVGDDGKIYISGGTIPEKAPWTESLPSEKSSDCEDETP